MGGKHSNTTGRGRLDRMIRERSHDPYRSNGSPPEPTLCPDCGVVYAQGRWAWVPGPPQDAEHALCPACRRTRDRVPAGLLTLSGEFFTAHRDEIMGLIHNKVDEQQRQHPLKRIMYIEDDSDGGVTISFTDTHLPRGVGDALRRAYEGEFEVQYAEGAEIVRAAWTR